jgi:predicted ATP-grasp superfamily ATP-dependent carboligase
LSATETGKAWLSQFALPDRRAAASLLDALTLMNDEQVATALRSLLADLAELRSGLRKRVALMAKEKQQSRLLSGSSW